MVVLHIYEQSPDIALGTNDTVGGAGDQGTITGYACNHNSRMIPTEKALADELVRQMYLYTRPNVYGIKSDMKSQVTIKYDEEGTPSIDTVVFACQHAEGTDQEYILTLVQACLIESAKLLGLTALLTDDTKFIVNGTGKFILGGPEADSGEVGRKIVVDAYGVSVPVGGGTYNGKDPSKVDRSAAYMARYVAKNIVAADLADECLITVSYCIGLADPISIEYDFRGTEKVPASYIIDACSKLFSFRPADIINTLGLRRPIYATSGLIGHFGLEEKTSLSGDDTVIIPWEQTNKAPQLYHLVKDSYI